MEGLLRSSEMIFFGQTLSLPRTLVGQSGFHFSRSSNLPSNTPIAPSLSRQNQAIEWVPDSSSSNLSYKQTDEWMGFERGARGMQGSDPWKTVPVRFQLQRKCYFGENFLLVGDDPMIGSWDPTRALPLNWSDGHIWTLELDIPVDLPIQYKLILQQNDQELTWQPGSDRILRTWDTKNTILVAEDWESAESQKVSEEQKLNQNGDLAENAEDKPTDHNRRHQPISGPGEESLIEARIEPFVVDEVENRKDESMRNSPETRVDLLRSSLV